MKIFEKLEDIKKKITLTQDPNHDISTEIQKIEAYINENKIGIPFYKVIHKVYTKNGLIEKVWVLSLEKERGEFVNDNIPYEFILYRMRKPKGKGGRTFAKHPLDNNYSTQEYRGVFKSCNGQLQERFFNCMDDFIEEYHQAITTFKQLDDMIL